MAQQHRRANKEGNISNLSQCLSHPGYRSFVPARGPGGDSTGQPKLLGHRSSLLRASPQRHTGSSSAVSAVRFSTPNGAIAGCLTTCVCQEGQPFRYHMHQAITCWLLGHTGSDVGSFNSLLRHADGWKARRFSKKQVRGQDESPEQFTLLSRTCASLLLSFGPEFHPG